MYFSYVKGIKYLWVFFFILVEIDRKEIIE